MKTQTLKVNTNYTVEPLELNIYSSTKDAQMDIENEMKNIKGAHSFYSLYVNSGSEKIFTPEGFKLVGFGFESTEINEKGNPVCRTHNFYGLVKQ